MATSIRSNLQQVVRDLQNQTVDIEKRKQVALGRVINLTFEQAANKHILDGKYINQYGYMIPPGGNQMAYINYKNGTTGRWGKRKAPLFISNKIVSRSGETYNLFRLMSTSKLDHDTTVGPFSITHAKNMLTVFIDSSKLGKKILALERAGIKPRRVLRKSLGSAWKSFGKIFKELTSSTP